MATTYLTRTNSSAGSGTKFTISTWLKRSSLSTGIPRIMEFYHSTSYYISLRFRDDSSSALQFYSESNGSGFGFTTNQVFRDVGAFYHIVLSVDTTLGTADDRQKLYINGEQVTSFSSRTNPTSSVDLGYNTSSATNYIGRKFENSDYFDGLMAHFNYIDGTAYPASTFGETNAASGIWTPLSAPSVTYGTNGVFLKFGSSGALGTDSSGNSNTFTVNGSGTQTQDAPSNVFCTLNALDNYYFGGTFSNGNTTVVSTSSGYPYCTSTFGVGKGKYYIEGKYVARSDGNDYSRFGIGYKPATSTTDGLGDETGEAIYRPDGAMKVNGSETSSWGATWATGDIISIALDCDNSKLYFSKNGVFQGGGNPTAGTGGIAITDVTTLSTGNYFFGFGDNSGSGSATWSYNFGNGYFGTTAVASGNADGAGYGIFEYAPPTGYYSLCTKNINTYG